MTPQISKRILELVANGMTIEAAFDKVMGHGAFLRLASDLYKTMRK